LGDTNSGESSSRQVPAFLITVRAKTVNMDAVKNDLAEPKDKAGRGKRPHYGMILAQRFYPKLDANLVGGYSAHFMGKTES